MEIEFAQGGYKPNISYKAVGVKENSFSASVGFGVVAVIFRAGAMVRWRLMWKKAAKGVDFRESGGIVVGL